MPLAKRKTKTAAKLPRRFDTKYLGEEPIFNEMPEDRKLAKIKAFSWYNYFEDSSSNLKYVIQYAKDVMNLDKKQIRILRQLSNNALRPSTEKLIRMSLRGWQMDHDELVAVESDIRDRLNELTQSDANVPDEPQVVAIKNPHSHLLDELDEMEDRWLKGEPATINLFSRQQIHNDTKSVVEQRVKPWIESRINEYKNHKDDYDLPAKEVKRRLDVLNNALKDVNNILAIKTQIRKPRKKTVSAEKLVSRLKFLPESNEFKIKSVHEVGIIGAMYVYMFNTKDRTLHVLKAQDGGFGAKGMAITNVAESKKIKLRKPDNVLPEILNKTHKQIEKLLNTLSTKVTESNCRSNQHMVLMRVGK